MANWGTVFIDELKHTGLLEWLGAGFGVAEVLLAKANKVWLYPAGIISVGITIYLFQQSGLYAETALNGYYLVMSIYGWWFWVHNRAAQPLPVTRSNIRDKKITIAIAAGGFVFLYFTLKYFTNSVVPVMDAFVSATAWAGMWLLAKRKLENWIWLNISNAIAIPLLFYKQLPVYALLTLFLFIVAVVGFFDWRKMVAEND